MSITGIGLILIFVSNILMLAVQTIRLETSVFNVIQTSFGNTWIIRMIITVILLGIWFAMDRKKNLSIKNKIPMLAADIWINWNFKFDWAWCCQWRDSCIYFRLCS